MKRSSCTLVFVLGLCLGALPAPAHAQSRNLQLMAQKNDYFQMMGGYSYSACWSYVHGDGRKYAVIGTWDGTAIYNVTNPAATYFVKFISGLRSTWREMKQYRNWMYVVTEAYTPPGGPVNPGLQIIRMTNPENPILAATYATNFHTSHTVSVDTARAILICNGTRSWAGTTGAAGMRILSLASPEAPVEIAAWPTATIPVPDSMYVHDSVPIGNRLYASSITVPGNQRVIDFADSTAPVQIKAWTYPGAFCHNAWPDATGNTLYVTDEVNGQPLKIFDISNLTGPVLRNTITSNPVAIVHNAHVRGNELYLANYTEGIRVLDISDPIHPAEFAYADSWAGASGGFNGVWEVVPFFGSDSVTVIASHMTTGLHVYQLTRNYGILRIKVVSQSNGTPVAGATVRLTSQGDSLVTPPDGIVQFAPSPGLHTFDARKFHYQSPSDSRTVSNGSRDTIVIEIPAIDLNGRVREAGTLVDLEEAEVEIDHHPAIDYTDASGLYELPGIPENTYMLHVRSPGHIPYSTTALLESTDQTAEFVLNPTATWDPIETGAGWVVGAPGDNAPSGPVDRRWTLADPLGTGSLTLPPRELRSGLPAFRDAAVPARLPMGVEAGGSGLWPEHEEEVQVSGSVQPEYDRSPPPGTRCYVTGQGTNPYSRTQADLDGITSLITPVLDMTGMAEPTIGYWRWFYALGADDSLAIFISNDNGGSYVRVETFRGILNSWEERAIPVTDYVAATNQVRLKFVATDAGSNTLVEAAIDDLVTYDAATPQVGAPGTIPQRLAFRSPSPNPSSGLVRMTLELPHAGHAHHHGAGNFHAGMMSNVEVDVLDIAGRRLKTLHEGPAAAGALTLQWDGRDESGRATGAGVYFIRARSAGEMVHTRIARVR